jgi:hypothetical protein
MQHLAFVFRLEEDIRNTETVLERVISRVTAASKSSMPLEDIFHTGVAVLAEILTEQGRFESTHAMCIQRPGSLK